MDQKICPECGGEYVELALADCTRPYSNHLTYNPLPALLAEQRHLSEESAASGVPIEHDNLVMLVDGLGKLSEYFMSEHFTELMKSVQEAQDAAKGDSNDTEIDSLRDALEQALGMLGLDLPEGREPEE